MRNTLAGIIGTFAPILIGVGAMLNTNDSLAAALALGLTFAVMIQAVGSVFGAVPLLGATLAGLLAFFLFGNGAKIPGTPGFSAKATCWQSIVIEALIIFLPARAAFGMGRERRSLTWGLGHWLGGINRHFGGGPVYGWSSLTGAGLRPGIGSGNTPLFRPALHGKPSGLIFGRCLLEE